MSEKDLSSNICILLASLDPVRVENLLTGRTGVGMPDVNIATGAWIELKWAKSWPKRESTPLRLPHFTEEQKRWALRRSAAGGECYLVLQVRQDWMVFDHIQMQFVGTLTRAELQATSIAYWTRKPSPAEICAVFRRGI